MPSIITASTASNTALNFSADTSGVLEIRTGSSPTTAMTIDGSQNVGVGTGSPGTKLDVNGSVRVSGNSQLQIFNGAGSAGVSIQTDNASNPAMTFATGGSERMRIDSAGNVGIGTTSPSSQNSAANQLVIGNNSTNVGLTVAAGTSSQASLFFSKGTGSGAQQAAGFIYYLNTSDFMAFGTANTERMRIDSSGNIFAPFNSTSAKLVVGGNGTNNALGAMINVRSPISSGASLNYAININDPNLNIAGGSNLIAWSHVAEDYSASNVRAAIGATIDGGGNGSLVFRTGGFGSQAERMRINASGALLIGTTTDFGANINTRVLSASGIGMTVQANTNGNWAHEFRNASGTNVGTIVINAGGTVYNTLSDYRLKDNIAPMTGALEKIAQLKPCTYTWKADGSASQGFIAHELQAVVPDAVTGEKDAVDEEGNPKYQGIDTSFLVATLTAAIQELKAELDEAKAEIQALKGAQ